VASQQSAPSARRSLNLNSTVSTSHRLGASKAPFASLCLCVCVPPFSLPNLSVVFVCLFLSQFVILPACLSVYPSASFVCVCVSRPVPDTENINIHPMHTRNDVSHDPDAQSFSLPGTAPAHTRQHCEPCPRARMRPPAGVRARPPLRPRPVPD